MADLDITQMTQLSAAPAADDVIYIGDVSEAVLDDQNKHIEIEDLFSYLEGPYEGDIVLATGATLDLALGTIHINEAVDLLATSTELNQLDGVSVGGSSAGDIATIDGTQTLTNKTIDFDSNTINNVPGSIQMVLIASGASVAIIDGTEAIAIPASFNGLDLIDALATVHTKGVTNTTDIQVRRRRAGADADMLSTVITIGDEFYANDGVIDTANDDVQTGDQIYIDVDAIHSTAPTGLTVVLSFG